MVWPGRTIAGNRSAAAGPAVLAGTGPRGLESVAGNASMATAAMPFTTLPSWRAGEARWSARLARRPLREAGADVGRRGAGLAAAVGVAGVGARDGVPGQEAAARPGAGAHVKAGRPARVQVVSD